jgi:hypothetical protein
MKTLYSSLFILLIAIQVSAQDSDELILLQAKADNYYNNGIAVILLIVIIICFCLKQD